MRSCLDDPSLLRAGVVALFAALAFGVQVGGLSAPPGGSASVGGAAPVIDASGAEALALALRRVAHRGAADDGSTPR